MILNIMIGLIIGGLVTFAEYKTHKNKKTAMLVATLFLAVTLFGGLMNKKMVAEEYKEIVTHYQK